jgi:hypothetical protein
LLPILAISVIGAAVQRHDAPRGNFEMSVNLDRYLAFNVGDFAEGGLRQIPSGSGVKIISMSRTGVRRNHIAADISAVPGDVVYTSLLTPARMLDIQGARVIGRWAGQPSGPGWQVRWGLVLQIDRAATPGKAHIVIREARSLPILGGRIISLFGLLGLAANAVIIASAARRRRRTRPAI